MSERNPTPRLLAMTGGLWIWAAQFTVVYAFTAVACARGFADRSVLGVNVVRLVIGAATLAGLALAGAILVGALLARPGLVPERGASGGDRLINHCTATVAALSLLAILYNGLPALILPVCPR